MKDTVGKGTFVLTVSGVVCKFFGALFRLPLTNIIGIEGIGIFQMIMSLYSLLLIFVSSGVTNSLSKLVSSSRAKGENFKLGQYFKYAIMFSGGIGLGLGVIFALFSKYIASLQGIVAGGNSYLLFIVLLPLGGLIGVYRGVIQGYENMVPTAFSQIIEQVIKFVFGLLFAFILGSKGASAGVFGAFLGITVSEILAFLYLASVMSKKIKIKKSKDKDYEARNEFFKASLPLSFSSAVVPLTHAIESMIIISLLVKSGYSSTVATSLYGLQTGVVGAILNFPLIISMAVAVALLPKVSFLTATKEDGQLKSIINKSFNVMWYFLIPLILGIASISKELYPIIYPNVIQGYLKIALQLTSLGAVSVIISSISSFLLSILQARGFFYHTLIFNIIGGIAKIVILIILAQIKEIAAYSIAISNIVMFSIICICSLIKLGSVIKINFFEFVLPLLSGVVMFLAVRLLLNSITGILGVVLSILLGGITYFVMAFPLTKEYFNLFIKKISKNKL